MATVDIRGDIISNDNKWIYDWLGWESTCPNDIAQILQTKDANEEVTVLINSGGGSVLAGQEIYSLLYGRDDVKIKIMSMAGSAAGVIAMANHCSISPVAMLMIHNVSMSGASGDYHDMQKNVEILKQMNAALANAFSTKTGKSIDEVLKIMDKETWLTARQALEMGFVDEITKDNVQYINDAFGLRLTDEIKAKVMKEKEQKDALEKMKASIIGDLDKYGSR